MIRQNFSSVRQTSGLSERPVTSAVKVLFIVQIVIYLPGCRDAESPENVTANSTATTTVIPNAKSRYAGSQSCQECHREISKSYDEHPMAHSLMKVSAARPSEDFDDTTFESKGRVRYAVEKDGQQIWHHEIQADVNGETIYDHRVPIHYAVGSGTRGRSYLTDIDGRLFQSPISWYAESHQWNLSPGYAPGAHPRFDRRVNHACLSCHAGISSVHDTDLNRFASPPFVEEAIGCERCHGPGSDHIDHHRLAADLRTQPDPIVNPKNLSSHLQDAVCNQCHLQGQRRVLNPGRTEFDFRPGMSLNEVWTTILKTQGVEDGVANAVSQVEQMHSSICFQKSEGAMTCTSCHDPHGYPTAEEKASYYQSACRKCHHTGTQECSETADLREARQDSCVACHMPHFGAADVHSSQTDHRILRHPRPGTPEESMPVQRMEDLRFFIEPETPRRNAEEERAAAIFLGDTGYLNNIDSASRHAVRILTPHKLQETTDVDALVALSRAYLQLDRDKDAIAALVRATELSPVNEEVIELLAITLHDTNQLVKARHYYDRLIKVNPNRARYYGRYAHVLGLIGDIRASIEAGEKALELDPSLSQTHEWLVQMYRQLGDESNATRHQSQLDLMRLAIDASSDVERHEKP